MAEQTCPKCGTHFLTGEDWAKSAVSLLIPAPAVPDMATQLRCLHCHHLFADSDICRLAIPAATRYLRSRVLGHCDLGDLSGVLAFLHAV
jgi:RNA polymerase subunit RPABC4/transcription elongation factor Spt4